MQSNYVDMQAEILTHESQAVNSLEIIYGKKSHEQLVYQIAYAQAVEACLAPRRKGKKPPKLTPAYITAKRQAIIKKLKLPGHYAEMKNIAPAKYVKLITLARALHIHTDYNHPQAVIEEEVFKERKARPGTIKIYRIFGNASRYVCGPNLYEGQPLGISRRECPMSSDDAKRKYEQNNQ